jgi:hypothetical protein
VGDVIEAFIQEKVKAQLDAKVPGASGLLNGGSANLTAGLPKATRSQKEQ